MAVPLPRAAPRRRRRSFARRPINARTYRGTWLLVGIPLLIAAFSMGEPTALPRANLPPEFDVRRAHQLVDELVDVYPNRRPGTPDAARAAAWVGEQLKLRGFRSATDAFQATLPARGRATLLNVTATAPGRSPDTIVVMAHRDDLGVGPGAVDNASGTAALMELAAAYGNVAGRGAAGPPSRPAGPAHTIVFLSTDGGAFGDHGARRFLERTGATSRIVAVVNLDSVARRGSPGVRLAADRPRSAPAALVRTASVRIADQTGREADVPGIVSQLTDLGFPFGIYEHALFVGRGIPAVTLTAAGDRAPEAAADTPRRVDRRTLGEIGRAAQALVASLDQALEVARGTSSYLYLGSRTIRGWAVELVLVSALLPFLIAVIDLFARCRRRRLALAPAAASYRRRLTFWLAVGGAFALFALLGVWGSREAGTPPPSVPAAGDWPVLGVAGLAALAALGWLVARERLLPRRAVAEEEELAGATVALLALGIVALVVAAVNPFALLFVLPSLHAWLWLPQVRHDVVWVRAGVLLAGFGGVALLLASFAVRFGLGLDAPWYVMRLAADGRVAIPLVVAFLAWLAAAGQLAAVSAGRYAPYPAAAERALRRPFRRGVRRLVLALRRPRKAAPARRRAVGG